MLSDFRGIQFEIPCIPDVVPLPVVHPVVIDDPFRLGHVHRLEINAHIFPGGAYQGHCLIVGTDVDDRDVGTVRYA